VASARVRLTAAAVDAVRNNVCLCVSVADPVIGRPMWLLASCHTPSMRTNDTWWQPRLRRDTRSPCSGRSCVRLHTCALACIGVRVTGATCDSCLDVRRHSSSVCSIWRSFSLSAGDPRCRPTRYERRACAARRRTCVRVCSQFVAKFDVGAFPFLVFKLRDTLSSAGACADVASAPLA
jgi:hypothetical protein